MTSPWQPERWRAVDGFDFTDITYHRAVDVPAVRIAFDRPEVRNALSMTRVQELRPIADELGITMAQLAVAWVLANDNVAGAIIGASRPEQVVENVAASGVELSADVLARIDAALGDVVVSDPKGEPVFRARIGMWVSPKPPRAASPL